jgi:GH24 family phage-related lysozyme (muramidase)
MARLAGTDMQPMREIYCIVTRNLLPGRFHPLCQVGEVDMAPFSSKFRQDLRKLERSLQKATASRSQATALGRKIEAQAQQVARRANRSAARGTGAQQAAAQRAAASHEPQVFDRLVRRGKAGWVNVPSKPVAALVEKGTGCVLVDSRGSLVLRRRIMLPSKPGINKGTFLRHLRSQGIEEYVPHMYLDTDGNVTVGIGHLVEDVDEAKALSFIKRDTNVGATATEIEQDFNRVKQSGLVNAIAPAFKPLTSLTMTEADAVNLALKDMEEFLKILRDPKYFPEFDTYPELAKMGILNLAYNVGADDARFDYKETAAAVLRRNWKKAGIEQRDGRKAPRIDIAQAWFNQAAQQEPFFISHTNCKKSLSNLV